jgi:hypothetical protein
MPAASPLKTAFPIVAQHSGLGAALAAPRKQAFRL